MTFEEKKQKLIDEVIEHIKEDINDGDLTAVDELLSFCPLKNLLGYLPEEKWDEFRVDIYQELIDAFKETGDDESEKFQTDNLDRAKLCYNIHGQVIVQNCDYGDTYPVSELTEDEAKGILYLILHR